MGTKRQIFENGGQWLEVDEATGELVWDGRVVATKQVVTLEGWSLLLAAIATAATVVSVVWQIVVHMRWI